MDSLSLAQITQDVGLPIGIFGLCAWLTIYIVKRLATAIDKLVTKMEIFTTRVRDEHDSHSKEHKAIMEQHRGIADTLGRINGFNK